MSDTEIKTGSGNEVEQSSENEVTGPLVFSCSKCKTIVGDSFSFLSSNQEANTVTISAASNIQRSTEIYTSYESLDEGSTYFCFLCSYCEQSLGRYYVTTSTDLDHIREKFTFSIDSITSYELGKAQHGKMPEPEVKIVSATGITASDGISSKSNVRTRRGESEQKELNGNRSDIDGSPDIEINGPIENVQEDVNKIQHVLVDLVQRVAYLERQLAATTAQHADTSAYNQNIEQIRVVQQDVGGDRSADKGITAGAEMNSRNGSTSSRGVSSHENARRNHKRIRKG